MVESEEEIGSGEGVVKFKRLPFKGIVHVTLMHVTARLKISINPFLTNLANCMFINISMLQHNIVNYLVQYYTISD